MKNDYIRRLQVNHIQAEDYCMRARYLFEKENRHTREEASLYCKAAVCYKENVELSIGEDQKHYREKMNQCAGRAQRIIEGLKKEKEVPKPNLPKTTVNRSTESKVAVKQESSDKDNSNVENWFRKAPKHSFADVAGMEELKKRLMACVSDTKYAGLKQYLKMKNLNAFFFYGPPGCGKTFLVEAFVHELMNLGYQFICLEAKDILSRYVGEAEVVVARMFELAEESAPCLVFIDEIDGVCKNRNLPKIAEYEASITTAFLTGYNHINSSDKEIVFIGATNFPERVDSAMHSRVELIRVPLPDREARKGYFEHVIREAGFSCTVSFDKMADMTYDYDYRDMSRLIETAKAELFEKGKELYPDSEQAIEALKKGEIILDEAVFMQVYNNYIPFPKKADKERLDRWESERRGEDSPEKANAKEENVQKRRLSVGERTFHNLSLKAIFEDEDVGWEKDADGNNKKRVHNPLPERDIERAYCFTVQQYKPETDHYQEAAKRYKEMLEEQVNILEAKERTPQVENRLNSVRLALENLEQINISSANTYKGYEGSNFKNSYDAFVTAWQGSAIHGFGGTCGIVACCNLINQQTGSRMREENGIREFVSYGLCYMDPRFKANGYIIPQELSNEEKLAIYSMNGGTSALQRKRYLCIYDLQVDIIQDKSFQRRNSFVKKESMPPELTLEKMEEAMKRGDSIELSIKIEDLRQSGLACRTVTERDPRPFWVNHATTVAGFSYDQENKVNGLWLNDTGGATLSNRVYISAEKFALMRENSRGFSAEFVRKRG